MHIKIILIIVLPFALHIPISSAQKAQNSDFEILPFGEGGTKKMIYDRRQRPQAVLMGNEIHLVYNGGASGEAKKLTPTVPFVISYNLKTGKFSESVQLTNVLSKDHHYGPIIWADNHDFLHVLSGCHKTAGTHLISKEPNKIGANLKAWDIAPEIAPSISYPSVSQITNEQRLIYYRIGEHRSSWIYRITSDEGNTWLTPKNSVVDLNNEDNLSGKPHAEMDEASSYHTYLPSKDGKSIHIAFMYYDDNKGNIPSKFYNSRYQTQGNMSLKFNLYYLKVDLETDRVSNFEGTEMKTPILLDKANAECKIWDTHWRGAGIPPDIIIDKNDNPAFLHVLTEEHVEKINYYYVRNVNNKWKQTIIAPACHKWNSSHLSIDDKGILHAYLLMDEGYFESKGKGVMNSHGGGTRIEEWISADVGNTWKKKNTLLKATGEYKGWRFNNVQPIKTKEGKIKDGIWLFYGWKESKGDVAQAKAFLLLDKTLKTNSEKKNKSKK